MKNYRVLVTARSFDSVDDDATRLLEEGGCEVVRLSGKDGPVPQQLAQELPAADAVIAGLEDYGRELLEKSPRLKVISRYGVGYDKVDISAAGELGIPIAITPNANGESVADLAVALMLAAARHVPYMDRCIRGETPERPIGVEMWEKTLGIIGAGRIGRSVARRCSGFRMQLLCVDTYVDEEFQKECGAVYTDFETVLQKADFITIHSPLTDETKNMFGEAQFRKMKSRSVLVNTARGGIIDEEALYCALRDGEIGAAGLDATLREPPTGSPLLTLSNCVITPHAGSSTVEASKRMSMMAAKNALDILSGKDCPHTVAVKP